ncbi:MAG: N-acetylmuramoyl-L-alanine amidase [Candidatus Eisenbacteria bacterium]|nr:N-acetylmuramoyl-L-alanine amidase [Candidatus Eisenbacteria bacterium]
MRIKGIALLAILSAVFFLPETNLVIMLPGFESALSPGGFCGKAFCLEVPYVPLSEIARMHHATKLWYPETRRMTLEIPGKAIKTVVGSRLVLIGGDSYMMSGPAVFVDGQVAIPLDFVEKVLNKVLAQKFTWDGRQRRLVPVETLVKLLGMDLYEDSTDTVLKILADSTISGEVIFPSRREFDFRIAKCEPGKGYLFPNEGLGLVERLSFVREGGGVTLSIRLTSEAESYLVSMQPDGVELRFTKNPNAGNAFLEKLLAREAKRVRKIVIDPGHGGSDAGVEGIGGSKEKDITLDIAASVKEFLERNSSLSVLLTRTEDMTVRQDERIEFLKNVRPDMVLSLHAEGYPSEEARGIYVVVPDGGGDLRLRLLGRIILDSFSSVVGAQDNGLMFVPIRLLKSSDTKGVVIDCGFLTSPVDEDLLEDPDLRKELGIAIGKGVIEFVNLQAGG